MIVPGPHGYWSLPDGVTIGDCEDFAAALVAIGVYPAAAPQKEPAA